MDVDVSQVILLLVPLGSALFVSNFGAKIGDVVRVVNVWNAASAPVILPALIPWITTGKLDFTVTFLTNIIAGFFAGATAAYTSVKKRNVGIRVQGMAWGFMLSAITTPLYTGLIRTHYPTIVPMMSWAIFAISIWQGWLIGTLYATFKPLLTAIFTALMGAYISLLTVASLGLPMTQGLAIGDMVSDPRSAALAGGAEDCEDPPCETGSFGGFAVNESTSDFDMANSGTMGCTYFGCYFSLFCTALYALFGFTNQRLMNDIDALAEGNPNGFACNCYVKILQAVWRKVSVFAGTRCLLQRMLAVLCCMCHC